MKRQVKKYDDAEIQAGKCKILRWSSDIFYKISLYRGRKKVDDVYRNTISADFRCDPNGLAV